jgi:hypothetical protein
MFTKDSRTENFLTQMGVEFRYTNSVTLSDLADGWDKVNLARPVPVREEAVIEYATLMEGGSSAPAPILYDEKGEGYVVLDGVQRLSAARLAGYTKLAAYVVSCDSVETLTAIRVLANIRLQGRAEPPEWTRRRAVEVLVVQQGLSADEVARMGGWKSSDISRLADILVYGAKIIDIGGPEMTDGLIDIVSKHATASQLEATSEPIASFLTTIKSAKFSAKDAESYVAEFFAPITKTAKQFATYSTRLEDFQSQPEVQTRLTGRRGNAMRRDVVLLRTLKSAETTLDELILEQGDVPYVDEFFRIMKSINEKLKTVAPNPTATSARVPADMWAK